MGSCGGDLWADAAKKSLKIELQSVGSNLIHRVPDSLVNNNTRAFYYPQVISLGPYHFKKKDPIRDEIEALKSEIVRIVNEGKDNKIYTVAENFESEDTQKRIKKSYAKELPGFIWPEVLAWMMVRDACFLMEVLRRFSENENEQSTEVGRVEMHEGEVEEMKNESALLRIDSILCYKRHHPLLNEIVKDMFKMENQLPFWVLDDIRRQLGETLQDDWFKPALKVLSPVEIVRNHGEYREKHHILQLLHEYIVDQDPVPSSSPENQGIQQNALRLWVSIYINFIVLDIFRWDSVASVLKFLLLSPVFFIWLILFLMLDFYQNHSSAKVDMGVGQNPTLEELKRVGVKVKKLEGGKGISHIKFENGNSTLHLPKFSVDDRSKVILRNLMVLEVYSEEVQKPITRYVLLMNDLVNTRADVAILRQNDIITNKLGDDDDAAHFWNSMIVASEMPKYGPIDKASASINAYRKKRLKVLWAQFRMVHCSKPWLFLSLLGGVSLLLLTVTQVACLFRNCQIRSAP